MRFLCISGCLLLLWLSCTQAANNEAKWAEGEVADSVTVVLHRYFDDIRTEGMKAEFRYLDSSAGFFWVPPGYTMPISYDSVRRHLEMNAASVSHAENEWITLKVYPLSASLASYTGTVHAKITDTAGKVTEFKLIETGVVIKREEGWKLLNGQTAILPTP